MQIITLSIKAQNEVHRSSQGTTVQRNVCKYCVCHSCSVFMHTGIVYDVLYCSDVLW